MRTLKTECKKIQKYLDYVTEHYDNILKAWKTVQKKCFDMSFIVDENIFSQLNIEVTQHDLSKVSNFEFIPYVQQFYDDITSEKKQAEYNSAWEHHKINNSHHWENWTKNLGNDVNWQINCVHMVVDWLAMSLKFGDTVKDYYERNKDRILIPEQCLGFLNEIIDRLNEK